MVWSAVFPDALLSVSMAVYFGVLGVVTMLLGGRARRAVESGNLVKDAALGGKLTQLGCLFLGAYLVGMALLWVWLFGTGV